jgi:hypothetical protein
MRLILLLAGPPSHGGDGGSIPLGLPKPRAGFPVVTAHFPPKGFLRSLCRIDLAGVQRG